MLNASLRGNRLENRLLFLQRASSVHEERREQLESLGTGGNRAATLVVSRCNSGELKRVVGALDGWNLELEARLERQASSVRRLHGADLGGLAQAAERSLGKVF